MFRYLIALILVLALSDAASAACRQPVRSLLRAVVPGRTAVHRERHVVRERAPAARLLVVPVKVAPCGPTGCQLPMETGPAVLGTKPLTLPLKMVPAKK